jgi:hypothetical protein
MKTSELQCLDVRELESVTGGKWDGDRWIAEPTEAPKTNATKANYGNMCLRGAADGAFSGLSGGAGMLPFVALGGGISGTAVGVLVGGSAVIGGIAGCGQGAWELYKARNPMEQ